MPFDFRHLYAGEKLGNAIQHMVISDGSLRDRLRYPIREIALLSRENLPSQELWQRVEAVQGVARRVRDNGRPWIDGARYESLRPIAQEIFDIFSDFELESDLFKQRGNDA